MRMWFLVFTLLCSTATASLHSKFRHYEEILSHDISIREKRDINNRHLRFKSAHFNALGKKFQLQLFPDSRILSHDFEVQLVDAAGKTEPTEVNTDGIYSGHERGNTRHKVHAVNHDGLWYFYIWTKDDVFVVEPVRRLDQQRTGSHLIAYKSSDVLTNSTKCHSCKVPFCEASKSTQKNAYYKDTSRPPFSYRQHATNGKPHRRSLSNVLPDGSSTEKNRNQFLIEKESRVVRKAGNEPDPSSEATTAPSEPDTCGLFVVVDYNTYDGVGRRSPVAIVKWLSHLLQIVDSVLRNSGLDVNGVTYGVKMRKLMIHKEFTSVEDGQSHYNMAHNNMSDTETLAAFSKDQSFAKHCLAHLVTQRKFGGVLGKAYIPTAHADDPHGICGEENLNVGLTTTIDESGSPIPIEMHVLTMAHEIGHNFGADHDPDDGLDCSPAPQDGGKFLMFPVSGAQRGANRQLFSPCSLGQVKDVVVAKAHKCFQSQKALNTSCGDGIVTSEEDCDFGLLKETTKDQCCTSRCRFRPGAVCSPSNHPCCTQNCQIAPKTQACIRDVANDCVNDSTCDGVDAFSCPRPSPKKNGSPCGENGTCWQGRCLSFCENLGRVSSPPRQLQRCNCDQNTTMMCRMCCMVKEGRGPSECSPMGGSMRDGASCLRGLCSQGVCGSKLKVGKIVDFDNLKEDIVAGKPSTLTIVFVFIACAGAFSMFVGSLFTSGSSTPSRQFSNDEETAIEELREMLEETIGHLNVSQNDDNNPTTEAIAQQLRDERKRIRNDKKNREDDDFE